MSGPINWISQVVSVSLFNVLTLPKRLGSSLTAVLGIAHWSLGDLEAARRAFAEWITDMSTAGNIPFAVASGFALGDILVEQGRLREAAFQEGAWADELIYGILVGEFQ